eukprot:PhM_4_TR2216/c0_g2_i1/m.31804
MLEAEFALLASEITDAFETYSSAVEADAHLYNPITPRTRRRNARRIVELKQIAADSSEAFYASPFRDLDYTVARMHGEQDELTLTTRGAARMASRNTMHAVEEHMKLSRLKHKMAYVVWRVKELTPERKSGEVLEGEDLAKFKAQLAAAKKEGLLCDVVDHLKKGAAAAAAARGEYSSKKSGGNVVFSTQYLSSMGSYVRRQNNSEDDEDGDGREEEDPTNNDDPFDSCGDDDDDNDKASSCLFHEPSTNNITTTTPPQPFNKSCQAVPGSDSIHHLRRRPLSALSDLSWTGGQAAAPPVVVVQKRPVKALQLLQHTRKGKKINLAVL